MNIQLYDCLRDVSGVEVMRVRGSGAWIIQPRNNEARATALYDIMVSVGHGVGDGAWRIDIDAVLQAICDCNAPAELEFDASPKAIAIYHDRLAHATKALQTSLIKSWCK